MKAFAALYRELDATTSTRASRRAAALLRSRRARRCRMGGLLPRRRQAAPARADASCCALLAHEAAGLPDGCSTSATRRSATSPRPSRCCCRRPRDARRRAWRLDRTAPAAAAQADARGRVATRCAVLDELDRTSRFSDVKLITGGFRVGVSRLLVTRALAEHVGRSTPSASRSG